MDVRCDRCKSQYTVDDAHVTEAGVTVRCPQCQHTFIVKKKAWVVTLPVKPGQDAPPSITLGAEPPPPPAPTGPPAPPSSAPVAEPQREREWRIRQTNGNLFTFRELTNLQRWIVERKVTRDDEISADGQTWKRLGNIPELAGFFLLVDEAQRAAELQVQARLGLIPGPGAQGPSVPAQPGVAGPPPAQEPPAEPPTRTATALPVEAPPAQPPTRGGSRWLLPVGLLALLGAGAGLYFGVLLPREQAAAREQAELRARLAKAEAEVQVRANTPATGTPATGAVNPPGPATVPPSEGDGGTAGDADAGALAGAVEAADAGETVAEPTPDAGLVDAGMAPDAGDTDAGTAQADAGGAPDAGTAPPDAGPPVVKRPEPVRDFDYWLAQGERQRERERADPAMSAYDKAAELAPERAEPYTGRGLVHLDLGDYSLAEAEFLRALKLNPRYGVALMGLAETYRSQGKKAEAIRFYERYLEVLPNGPEAAVARSALERLRE